ncbi:peptidase family m20 m25 m40 protein [Niveomyces insectorum RCEF 264]|uniref:Peptidase family m20 m25 m40 protein n=1 Tax=Niveomyces insectorum RCEF 264 TaxID=1081102 RepID=A0A167PGC6_9HYPO|nr:peptidase family m20 m25 m40 protein [Niveomyces insectorum RCEF 264]
MADAVGTVVAAAAPSTTPTTTTLEALQRQASHTRRLRPPDVHGVNGGGGGSGSGRGGGGGGGDGDEKRIPLRASAEKLAHRESRLGLRSLFTRNKPGGVHDVRASIVDFGSWPYAFSGARSETTLVPNAAQQPRQPPNQQQQEGEQLKKPPPPRTTIKQGKQASAASASSTESSSKPRRTVLPLRSRTPVPSARPGRGSLATWDPPPLFQAYPQAIKHVQLPVCTTSIDMLLRLQGGSRGGRGGGGSGGGGSSIGSGISVRGSSPSDSATTTDDGAATPGDGLAAAAAAAAAAAEKPKRRHRRNTSASSLRLDWINKIYVLVTSGYLLQYAAEGSFDRLPEKILHISKDSAAFASDLIPGRHWVLQVSSAMGADGTQVSDARSLFSRLPFRGSERRHASTFLMVFENADEMESWITTLRREIEHLGGKKHLSETGKPKADDFATERTDPTSQRTLVVRDPGRFSRIINPQDLPPFPWPRDNTMNAHPSRTSAVDGQLPAPAVLPDTAHEHDPTGGDDRSITNSLVSHDGRQLDNLRDSGGHRFSYISSGQRTMVTSDSSSPPCSPIRDSFASIPGEEQALPPPPSSLFDTTKEARPRSNAAAIVDRRQSMQQVSSPHRLSDLQLPQHTVPSAAQSRLPVSSITTASPEPAPTAMPLPVGVVPLRRDTGGAAPQNDDHGAATSSSPTPPAIPNFSVPHSSSKRYSAFVRSPPPPELASVAVQETTATDAASRRPPTTQPVILRRAPEAGSPPQQAPPIPRNSGRRLPPPSLAFSRPLSIVTDHPSPGAAPSSLPRDTSNASIDTCSAHSPGYDSDIPDTPSLLAPWSDTTSSTSPDRTAPPSKPANAAHIQLTVRTSPRKHASMLALRSSDAAWETPDITTFVVPYRGSMAGTMVGRLPASKYTAGVPPPPPPPFGKAGGRTTDETQRANAEDRFMHNRHRSQSPPALGRSARQATHPKRASMFAQPSHSMVSQTTGRYPTPASRSTFAQDLLKAAGENDGSKTGTSRGRSGAAALEPLAARPSASNVHLRPRSMSSRAVLYRRSMPQLADGPPPAPPPTCALPPLPSGSSDLDNRRKVLPV